MKMWKRYLPFSHMLSEQEKNLYSTVGCVSVLLLACEDNFFAFDLRHSHLIP